MTYTVSINDRLGDGGLENVGILSTDSSGNTIGILGSDGRVKFLPEVWTRFNTGGQNTIVPTGFGYSTGLVFIGVEYDEFETVTGVLLNDIVTPGSLTTFVLADSSYPYTKFRIRAQASFSGSTTGNRSLRILDNNSNILSTIIVPNHSLTGNTMKVLVDTGWRSIASIATRPTSFSVLPGQDSGINLNVGGDTATPSFLEIAYKV